MWHELLKLLPFLLIGMARRSGPSDWKKQGGGEANPRAKQNQPDRVMDRYRGGTRRWSFYKGRKQFSWKNIDQAKWWTILKKKSPPVGCFPGIDTWECDCPDFSKAITASPFADESSSYSTRQFTPRTFSTDSVKRYKSDYSRYMRGQALASRVEFIGFTPPDTFEYRLFTDRAERYDRNWSSSGAGVETDKWCKHIWAAVIYRGDPYTVPLDIPDYDEDGYSDLYDEAWILNDVDLL